MTPITNKEPHPLSKELEDEMDRIDDQCGTSIWRDDSCGPRIAKYVLSLKKTLELDEKRVTQDSRRRAALENSIKIWDEYKTMMDTVPSYMGTPEGERLWANVSLAHEAALDALTAKHNPYQEGQ